MGGMLNALVGSFAPATSSSSFESIATVNGGGTSSINFTSIPSTYNHLQIRSIAGTSDATGVRDAQIQFNNDTNANYSRHWLYSFGSSLAALASSGQSSYGYGYASGTDTGSAVRSSTIIDILDYANTSKYKTIRGLNGTDRVSGGNSVLVFSSGGWYSTSAITSITITMTSGSFASNTQFALYGIKGS
jgi:hypothetical protein